MNRNELGERDALGRRRAQEEFERPVVLEAGAGTGKTATLVARMLAWGLGPGWQRVAERETEAADDETIAQALLSGVVAITFTEAAAAEMSTRFGSALSEVARGRADAVIGFDLGVFDVGSFDDDGLARRARALLSHLDHLTVRTIHAFCRSLLATYPLEARVHPDFVVDADGSRRRAVLREILEEAILTSYSREEPDALSHLASLGVGADRLFEALDALVKEGARSDLFRRDPFDDEGVHALRGELAESCRAFLDAGGDSLRATSGRSKFSADAVAAVDATLQLAEVGGESSPEPTLLFHSLRTLWEGGLSKRLPEWKRGRLNVSERDVFDGDGEAFSHAALSLRNAIRSYEKIDVAAFSHARRAVRDLLERAERELRASGIATFAELLGGAERLLIDEPAVRARERRRIDQLLVDEFQDTDPRQCTIVRLLALDGPADERPGLFIVGDPKQSIYGWREADLAAYEAFLAAVEATGGERHLLTTNFRSTAAVLAEVDRVMQPVMREAPGLQPRYERLVPSEATDRKPSADEPLAIEHWIEWVDFERGPRGRSEEIAELEAEAVARDIERYRSESGAAWSDCAILYRGRGRLEAFQNALRARGIPYAVSRDVGYYRRREVIEAAAFVRAVLNPTDHLALVTLLRSTLVGVPDAALLPLWQRKLPDLVTRLRSPADPTLARLHEIAREVALGIPAAIPGIERIAGWEEALVAAFDLIATARELFREVPADRFVEELRRRSLFEVGEAARYQGEYRLANLERFFRQLETALVDPGREVEGVLNTLRSSIQIQPDVEEAKPQGPEEDSVQLMTIHVAKGLEFRSVWIVQLHSTTGHFDRAPAAAEFDRRDGPDAPHPKYALFGWPTPFRHHAEERERRVEEAERVRTLYVAMTRARERLVLSGSWPIGAPPDHWSQARSQIGLLQMRDPEPPPLAELWEELSAGGESAATRDGVRWAFPALDPARGAVRPPHRSRTEPPVQRWRDEAAAYDLAIATAAARSARPLHTAASSLHGKLTDAATDGDPAERESALLTGTLVHSALEAWRFGEPTATELDRAREHAFAAIEAASPTVAHRTTQRLELLFDRLASATLLERLADLASTWHARELPLITSAPTDDPDPADGPLQAITGSIDLVYRDSADERFVIVDYKTDFVDGDEAIQARAEAYRPQIEVYRDAIQRAFATEHPPRAELWFLWPDRVVPLD